MLLLHAYALKKRFGAQDIFSIEELGIYEGDRIGLVGRNGSGKSTLLSALAGECLVDSGHIECRCAVAVIRQDGEPSGVVNEHERSLLGLRASVCKSGGERTRLAIAAAFSADTPLLLADEPTTNLDMSGVAVLQKRLNAYVGALVLVSHDRTLLDAVCTQIWELDGGALRVFPGKYTDWQIQKQREREFMQFEYDQYRAEQERLRDEIARVREQARGMNKAPKRMGNSEARLHRKLGVKSKQAKVQSRAKQMEGRLLTLDTKERPGDLPHISMPLGDATPLRTKTVAWLEPVTVQYGTRTVLKDAELRLPTGSRTVLLGANGAGKSTLVRMFLDKGRFAQGVRIGYFAQGHETLDLEKSVLQNARADSDLPEHVVRTILANLYFGADEMGKPVVVLSGGERAKVQLAKLLAAQVHLLILDEPTNHLDLYTLEALEKLLEGWQGTLLLITHDRHMASQMATRLVLLEDGRTTVFDGGMTAWEESKKRHAMPRDVTAERLAILEIRIAAVNARMSCPKKGDNPEALREEWEQLLAEKRALQQ